MRKKINLLNLSKKEMKKTTGGVEIPEVCVTPNCGCLCNYANCGGSSTSANCSANHVNGQYSDGGDCPPAP